MENSHRDLTPLKRVQTTKMTENLSPIRTSRNSSVCESKLNLQFWGNSYLSENKPGQINLIELDNEQIFKIYSGETHMFINTKNRNLYGYGDNTFKQIENSAQKEYNANLPMDISSKISVGEISCGCDYSYMIGSKTKVYSWGLNIMGQLGQGHFEQLNEPTLVKHFQNSKSDNLIEFGEAEFATEIQCGSMHVILKTNKERLFSTGFGETYALGNGTTDNLNTFKEISFFSDLTTEKKVSIGKFEAGVSHSACVISKRMFIWGMFGKDKNQVVKRPVMVGGSHDVVEFLLGDLLTVLLTENGEVFAVGENTDDQLTVESNSLVKIAIPCKIEYIAGGLNHVFAVNFKKGKIFAWGSNRLGQIHPGNAQLTYATPTEMTWLYQNGSFALTCKGNATFFVSKSQIKLPKESNLDSVKEKIREGQVSPSQNSNTLESRQITAELEAKNKAFELLNKENQQLRDELNRLTTVLANSNKQSNTSTLDSNDANGEINDCFIKSDFTIQKTIEKRKNIETLF